MAGTQWLSVTDSFETNAGALDGRTVESITGRFASLVGSTWNGYGEPTALGQVDIAGTGDGYAHRGSRNEGYLVWEIGGDGVPPGWSNLNFPNQAEIAVAVDLGSGSGPLTSNGVQSNIEILPLLVINTTSALTIGGNPAVDGTSLYFIGAQIGEPVDIATSPVDNWFGSDLSDEVPNAAFVKSYIESNWGGKYSMFSVVALCIDGSEENLDFVGSGGGLGIAMPPSMGVAQFNVLYQNSRISASFPSSPFVYKILFDTVGDLGIDPIVNYSIDSLATVSAPMTRATIDFREFSAPSQFFATINAPQISWSGPEELGPATLYPKLHNYNMSWGFSGGWKVGSV